MKQLSRFSLWIILAVVVFTSSHACAGGWLNNMEVRNLLSGNTVTGFYMKRSASQAMMEKRVGIRIKFHADGRAEQTTDRADSSKGLYTEKGKWFVNKKGALCMTWEVENKKKCGRVRPGSNGAYELVRKQKTFVYEKITPGT